MSARSSLRRTFRRNPAQAASRCMSGSTSGRSCPTRRRGTDPAVTGTPAPRLDEGALRALVPRVLAGLVRRGEDFDAAEDALQEALLEALRVWPEHPPRDPRAWLTTVATRRLVDARRSEVARQRREETTFAEPQPASTKEGDDTLFLLFCCCHPDLAPASQVALTLRAVGGLTTREIADAFYVPEATMAQRISRAKRTLRGRRLDQPGDLAVVLRVLYLVYTAGHAGRVDLAGGTQVGPVVAEVEHVSEPLAWAQPRQLHPPVVLGDLVLVSQSGSGSHSRLPSARTGGPRRPTRREMITAIITSQPPRDWNGHE